MPNDQNLQPDEQNDYIELLLKTEVLAEIRSQFTSLMNERFPEATHFESYQSVPKNEPFNTSKITAAEVIARAYPVLKYDNAGNPLDNREQQYIDTVTNFTRTMADMEKAKIKMSENERELYRATAVYAALSAVETQRGRLKRAKNPDEIEEHLMPLKIFCTELKKSLTHYQRVVERGARAATAYGRWQNLMEDLIQSIEKFIERHFSKKEPQPGVFLSEGAKVAGKKSGSPKAKEIELTDIMNKPPTNKPPTNK